MLFTELTKEAQAKAIDNNRYICVEDSYWYESLIEEFKASLETKGFRDVKISFSGFSSQGDGASFTSDYMNIEEFLRSQGCFSKYRRYVPENNYNEISYDVRISRLCHRYSHENTVYTDDQWNHWTTENQEEKIKDIILMITEFVKDESREIYKALEAEYNACIEDEYVADFLIANEYEFDEDGEWL